MTRETVAARVRDLAGPLGPFRSIDQQTQDTDRWLDSMGAGAVPALVDFFVMPPNGDELQSVAYEEFIDVVDELLCLVATKRPAESVPLLMTYLADDRARPYAARALGATGSDDAQAGLAAYLAANPELPAEQIANIVEAIAEIGGPKATG